MSKAFAGLVLVFGLASVPAVPAVAADVREVHRTVALDARGTVALRTFKGSVEVEPWGEPQADVFARIEADTSCGNDSRQAERVRLTEVDFESTGSRLELRSNYDKLEDFAPIPFHTAGFDTTCSARPFIHYRLRIPRGARLDVEDHKSKIAVSGLRSDARIHTHKGSVDVKGHEGALDLSTHKGDVRVEFARLAGDSRLESYKGDIDAAFRLDERIVNRRERVYEQKVNGGGPRLELSTRNGSIQITEK